MTADPLLWVALALALAAAVLAWLSWRGSVSWAWLPAVLGLLAAVLGLRRPRGPFLPPALVQPPPRPPPARVVVAPVVDAADAQADDAQAAVAAANDDPDRLARLDRLAGLNDGGRDR